MKFKIILSAAVLIVVFLLNLGFSENSDIIRLGVGNLCKWSPSGEYLSFTRNNQLMIYDVKSKSLDSLAPIFDTKYEWMSDSEIVVKQRNVKRDKNTTIVEELFLRYSLNGTIDTMFAVTATKSSYVKYNIRKLNGGKLCISHDGYSTPDSLESMRGGKSLDSNNYYVISNYDYWQTRHWAQEKDDDIWLIRYDGYPFKRVTTGKTYRMPQLSPDGKKIVCSSGRGMTILDLDGHVLGRFESAEMESWLSDSENLVFTKVIEKDDDIVASDIYIADVTGNNEIKITDTPDKIELLPAVSPDRTMVAYISYEIDANYMEIINIEGMLKRML